MIWFKKVLNLGWGKITHARFVTGPVFDQLPFDPDGATGALKGGLGSD
jgi:hypothetical protein